MGITECRRIEGLRRGICEGTHLVVLVDLGLEVLLYPARAVVAENLQGSILLAASFSSLLQMRYHLIVDTSHVAYRRNV